LARWLPPTPSWYARWQLFLKPRRAQQHRAAAKLILNRVD
jgi:hypothetical protein